MSEVGSLFTVEDKMTLSSEEEDEDVCDSEGNSRSTIVYGVENERALSLDKIYVLNMSKAEDKRTLFASLSNKTSIVFDLETLTQVTCFHGHTDTISGINVCPDDENLVMTSSLDGTLKLWDVRLNKNCVREYKDASEGDDKLKPITAFDIAPSKPLILAGTEQYEGDAFLLFWDRRSTKLLGGYWDSHLDDVTHVTFHSSNGNRVATCSTDGLVNVFDISQETEDDSLLYSLNSESSVDKVDWCVLSGSDALACVTHTEDLQLWNVEDALCYARFPRSEITTSMLRRRVDQCYISDVHVINNNELYVLVGSLQHRGECLKLLKLDDKKLIIWAVLSGNKQIVRTSCYFKTLDLFVTGGESGLITVWTPGLKAESNDPSSNKITNKRIRDSYEADRKPY